MPRISKRRMALMYLKKSLLNLQTVIMDKELFEEDKVFEEDIYLIMRAQYKSYQKKRYITRNIKYRKNNSRWEYFVFDLHRVNSTEFLNLSRMSRNTFHRLYEMVNKIDVKNKISMEQLLVTLRHYGSEGAGSTATSIYVDARSIITGSSL